jgi:hypothetical protein
MAETLACGLVLTMNVPWHSDQHAPHEPDALSQKIRKGASILPQSVSTTQTSGADEPSTRRV